MDITWNTHAHTGCIGKIVSPDSREVHIYADWDIPGVAMIFGWSVDKVRPIGCMCEHIGTDGTIDCPTCKLPVVDFIASARQWLEENDGAKAEDPDYFRIGRI